MRSLAVIIPAHDEESVLERTLRAVRGWADASFPDRETTVIVSENGSKDGTRALAARLVAELPRTRLVASDAPGKGGAIKRAAAAIEADAYLFMDADLSTDLASAAAVVRALDGADLAFASRRHPQAVTRRAPVRHLGSIAYAALATRALGLHVADLQCGCKAFTRRLRDEVLPAVRDDGFFFDTEFLARAARSGATLREVPVRWDEWAQSGRKSKVKAARTFALLLAKLAALRRELAR